MAGLRRALAVSVLGTVSILGGGCVSPGLPGPSPIGAHQRFSGLVNGTSRGPVISTVCGGPVWEGRTGPVVSGQTVAVTQDPDGDGLTDRGSIMFARVDSSAFVVQVTAYDSPVVLPEGLEMPCDGAGVVTFDPCYGFVGCLDDGHAAVVKVTFENIAR